MKENIVKLNKAIGNVDENLLLEVQESIMHSKKKRHIYGGMGLVACFTVLILGVVAINSFVNGNFSVANNQQKGEIKQVYDNTVDFKAVDISKIKNLNTVDIGQVSFAYRCCTVEEIYNNSTYIVKGTVEKSYYTVLEDWPYYVIDIKIEESIKGDIKENSIITVLSYVGYASMGQEISYGEEYVLCLGDSGISKKGAYAPINQFETVFKKTGDKYVRTLPTKDYYGYPEKDQKGATHLENDVSFNYDWFITQIEKLN